MQVYLECLIKMVSKKSFTGAEGEVTYYETYIQSSSDRGEDVTVINCKNDHTGDIGLKGVATIRLNSATDIFKGNGKPAKGLYKPSLIAFRTNP